MDIINRFDLEITDFLNNFAQNSVTFDLIISLIAANHLMKGGVLLMVFWWFWMDEKTNYQTNRRIILSNYLAAFFSMFIARLMALSLPFRNRPMHEQEIKFIVPFGTEIRALDGWSSFPSDHAALFFTLATGIFLVSRKAGIFAYIYTTLFIAFPRIYLGLHYFTDILGGAVTGIILAFVCMKMFTYSKPINKVLQIEHEFPRFFYPLMFLFTYQIADMFESSRALLRGCIAIFYSMI